MSWTYKPLKYVLSEYKMFFLSLTLLLYIINLFFPVLFQMLVAGDTRILYGIGPPPKKYIGPLGEGIDSLFWLGVRYDTYFPNAAGETYWILGYTYELIFLALAASVTASTAISTVRLARRYLGGKCKVEKGVSGAATTLTTIGISTISTTLVSCPSCGFSSLMTIAAVVVSASTGSLLGISALYTSIMKTPLAIGTAINVGVYLYLGWRLRNIV